MVYKWSIGLYAKVDANLAGSELERIERENGEITNTAVVDAARPEDSVLHCLFDWDDREAAEKWRRTQASNMIGALIVVKDENTTDYSKRAFVNVVHDPHSLKSPPRYIRIDNAMANTETRKILLNNAKQELKRFKEKYSCLNELADVFALIDQM